MGENLLRYQKKLAGMIAEKRGNFHSDPVFSQLGMLKISDLYRQQLRIYAWKFTKNKLPSNQMVMLCKVNQIHTHNTRSARSGLFVSTQDHRAAAYRIPKEWQGLPEKMKELNSLGGLKRNSKKYFISKYAAFKCNKRDCFVCAPAESHNVVDDG